MQTALPSLFDILTGPTEAWPDFAGGRQAAAFAALNQALAAQGAPVLWSGLPRIELGFVESIRDNPPAGWSGDPDWIAMISVVERIVGIKAQIRDYYTGVDLFLDRTRVQSMDALDRAAQWAGMSTPAPVPFDFLGLFSAIAGLAVSAAGVAVPGAGAVNGVIGLLHWIIQSQGGGSTDPWKQSFTATVDRIHQEVNERYGKLTDAVAESQDVLLADYGRCQRMSSFLSAPQTQWPDSVDDLFTPPVLDGAELAMWQSVLPARWPLLSLQGPLWVRAAGQAQEIARIAQCSPQWYVARVGSPRHTEGGEMVPLSLVGLAESAFGEQLDPHAAQRLFTTLGASRDDVFQGNGPWSGLRRETQANERAPDLHPIC